MADRDVTLDVVARDKTGPGIASVNRNLKSVEKSWKDVDGQGKRTLAAASKVAGDMGRGFAKIGGAASRWANSGNGIGKKFVRGIGTALEGVSKIGGTIGKGLSDAVAAAGPYVQVALAAVLVGAAVAAMPAVGAAIVGGAAGMGIVGGLVLAARDARVQGAFTRLKGQITSQLEDAAQSFVPAALSAIDTARGAFRRMLPDIQRIFGSTSGFVEPLTRALGVGFQRAIAGIAQAVERARPIIDVIGQGIVMVGTAVGDVFKRLSDNGSTMAAALKGVFYIVTGAIYTFSLALNAVIETLDFFIDHIPGARAALEKFTGATNIGKAGATNLAGGFRQIATDANGAATGLTNLKAKQDELAGSNISLYRAQIASRDATKQATSAINENNKAKLTNQQRSDRNMTALLNMADAFNTESDAGDRSGVSANKASQAYANNRAKLIAMAEKAGYSKQKAEELAAKLLKIPKNVNTDVNVNTASATAKLETLQKKIRDTKGKTVTITVQVLSNGNHRMPGGGQLTKDYAAYNSWSGSADSGATSRVGGPTKVESTINQTLNVLLDGELIDRRISRQIARSDRRQKVGRR